MLSSPRSFSRALALALTIGGAPALAQAQGVIPGSVALPAPDPAMPAVVPTPQTAAPVAAPAAPAAPAPSQAQNATTPPVDQPAAAAKPKKPKQVAPVRETAILTDSVPTLSPETFFLTAKASERYAAVADAGGWPVVPGKVGPGDRGAIVTTLRKRLSIEGDLDKANEQGDAFDPMLLGAVKSFQARNGLKQTGIVAGATLRAINIPAAVRFKQLASSAQRIAGNKFPFGDRYVISNIPSASVEAVERGEVVHRYVAVVGDPDHKSPEIEAKINAVNLNPTWTVPASIIKKEIIPHMRRDPSYLSRAKIRILDGHGEEINPRAIDWNSERAVNYTLRQDSGAGNSLGSIRISMPNKEAVYMHDTPSKRLFGSDYRFLSHGCVRVEGVYDLAEWLLQDAQGGTPGQWDKKTLLQKIATGAREDIKLAHTVPVIWVYLTGWADKDGIAHFRDDVYQIDTVGGV